MLLVAMALLNVELNYQNQGVLDFIALAVMQSFYLRWDYNNPEFAVAGTILHGFEFVFVRLAPLAFIASIIGIIITYKKR